MLMYTNINNNTAVFYKYVVLVITLLKFTVCLKSIRWEGNIVPISMNVTINPFKAITNRHY